MENLLKILNFLFNQILYQIVEPINDFSSLGAVVTGGSAIKENTFDKIFL